MGLAYVAVDARDTAKKCGKQVLFEAFGEDTELDKTVVEKVADPLVHDRITPRLFTEASHAMGLVFQRADRFDDPILFLLPGDDRLVDSRRTLVLARGIPSGEVTIRTYPGMYHEVLNERDRTLVHR